MLRVIGEIQPTFVVGENVYGLLNWSGGLVFDEVQTDLENIGYEVTPFILPACGVNAPHKRDRIWFVAHAIDNHWRPSQGNRNEKREYIFVKPKRFSLLRTSTQSDSDGHELRRPGENRPTARQSKGIKEQWQRIRPNTRRTGKSRNVTNTNTKGLQGSQANIGIGKERSIIQQQSAGFICPGWNQFPTQSPVCRRDDGISKKLDFPNRASRIKALGNSMVPQVIYEIFKAIELSKG